MFVREATKLIMLVYLTVKAHTLTVHLNIKNEKCPPDVRTHYLSEGDSLHFEVPDNFQLKDAWCHAYLSINNSSQKFEWQSLKPETGVISFTNVNTDMNTTWKCTLLKDRLLGETRSIYHHKDTDYTAVDCIVHIHVMKNYVKIMANGLMLDVDLVNNSQSEYDYAEYHYRYQDGEIVDTTCDNVKKEGGLRMKYNDANNNILFIMKSDFYYFMPNFRSLMKLQRNNSYLDCIYSPRKSNRKFVFRTYFIMEERETRNNKIRVLVDGLELVHRPLLSETATPVYKYYYINGEPLTLECRVYDDGEKPDTTSETKIYYEPTVTEHCGPSYYKVDIYFVSELFANSFGKVVPRISGLRANSILYEYTSDVDEWTIHYQYTRNETLNLTCVSTAAGRDANFSLLWRVRGATIFRAPQNIDKVTKILKNSRSVTLDAADNMTSITCFAISAIDVDDVLSKVVIILHDITPPEVHQATENVENRIQNGTNQIEKQSDPEVSYLGWIIAGATIGTVVIVAGICVPVVCRYMRSQIRGRYENPNYENFGEDERPIPIFPSQWNDYAGSDAYYSTIDEGHMVANNYYQGILFRSSNVTNKTQNYYTEINVPQNLRHSKEYAEVVQTDDQRRNAERSDTPAGGYANDMASADYAEPTYCSTQLTADARLVKENSGNG